MQRVKLAEQKPDSALSTLFILHLFRTIYNPSLPFSFPGHVTSGSHHSLDNLYLGYSSIYQVIITLPNAQIPTSRYMQKLYRLYAAKKKKKTNYNLKLGWRLSSRPPRLPRPSI